MKSLKNYAIRPGNQPRRTKQRALSWLLRDLDNYSSLGAWEVTIILTAVSFNYHEY
jgi:hypothetical protein